MSMSNSNTSFGIAIITKDLIDISMGRLADYNKLNLILRSFLEIPL
jgi:hypothetical protein